MQKIHQPHAAKPNAGAGFTLIEIMVVTMIIAVLLTVAGSGASKMMVTFQMKESIESVRYQMEHARQIASTKNCEVIVRIYQEPDFDGVLAWRSIEFGIAEVVTDPLDADYEDPEAPSYEPPFKRLGSRVQLPASFYFHPSPEYSSLLSTNTALNDGQASLPGGEARKYKSFVCQPDGRCNLPTTTHWTLTIVPAQPEGGAPPSGLPANYATLELDPTTSRIRVYRP